MPASPPSRHPKVRRRFGTAALATAVALLSALAFAAPANAAVSGESTSPQACVTGNFYVTQKVGDHFFPMGIIFTSGPSNGNLTMESKVEFNLSVGAKFTGSASGDLSAITAEAKIQLGIEVSMNVSIGQSFTTRYGPNG